MRKDSNFKVMARMSLEVKPLFGYMVLAVFLGVTGFLCAICIPYLGAILIGQIALQAPAFPITTLFIIILVLALFRGILHYGEQGCNHYIAFKLLAMMRDKVFKVLRRLCPAKLEGRDKGDLIYIITSDIEALEVFYAHTISPVLIAIITSAILLYMFASLHILFFFIACFAYCTCGIFIPLYITHIGKQKGINRREKFGELSNYTLESLRGMQEILQYHIGKQRLSTMHKKSVALNDVQASLKTYEAISSSWSMVAVTSFSLLVFLAGCYLYLDNALSFTTILMATVLMLSSFGPVLALSNLSNNLLITIASARRVLHLLDEEALVEDINGCANATFGDIQVNDVTFAYDDEEIVTSLSATFEKGKVTGILGKSGSGKSTLLKLIMRFWTIQKGKIQFQDTSIDHINTRDLRDLQSFVTQDTTLFHDSILNNIRIAKLDATMQEVQQACIKASIHDFISSLPKGYETPVEELGDSLSGGEKQRIGIARAFLHDSPCILLDEPTSNLDALNEAVILKSIREQKDKTILLVSHRPSTMKIADAVICVENGRVS